MERSASQPRRPSYLSLYETGELARRIKEAYRVLSPCRLCPRQCGVDRPGDERGACRTGLLPVISSFGPHFGEEPPLSGWNGSGTIFFTHCNLQCIYCQNYGISQEGHGREVSIGELAGMMLSLQGKGCHNINLVSPTHVVPQVLAALEVAISRGLALPLVYNTGTYDLRGTLALLDGVIDIYMPDTKYGQQQAGRDLSGVPGYPAVMMDAIREMHRQVGNLACIDGLAVRGLLVRHLVLPGDLAGSETIMHFIATELSPDSYVNIMAQYHPAWRVVQGTIDPRYRQLMRGITVKEYADVVAVAKRYGLHRGFDGQERC